MRLGYIYISNCISFFINFEVFFWHRDNLCCYVWIIAPPASVGFFFHSFENPVLYFCALKVNISSSSLYVFPIHLSLYFSPEF